MTHAENQMKVRDIIAKSKQVTSITLTLGELTKLIDDRVKKILNESPIKFSFKNGKFVKSGTGQYYQDCDGNYVDTNGCIVDKHGVSIPVWSGDTTLLKVITKYN